jgi:hypothetical protein
MLRHKVNTVSDKTAKIRQMKVVRAYLAGDQVAGILVKIPQPVPPGINTAYFHHAPDAVPLIFRGENWFTHLIQSGCIRASAFALYTGDLKPAFGTALHSYLYYLAKGIRGYIIALFLFLFLFT